MWILGKAGQRHKDERAGILQQVFGQICLVCRAKPSPATNQICWNRVCQGLRVLTSAQLGGSGKGKFLARGGRTMLQEFHVHVNQYMVRDWAKTNCILDVCCCALCKKQTCNISGVTCEESQNEVGQFEGYHRQVCELLWAYQSPWWGRENRRWQHPWCVVTLWA